MVRGFRGAVSRIIKRVAAPIVRAPSRVQAVVSRTIAPIKRVVARQPPTVRAPSLFRAPARNIPAVRPAPIRENPIRASLSRPALAPAFAQPIAAGGLEYLGEAEDIPVYTAEEIRDSAPIVEEEAIYDENEAQDEDFEEEE